MLNLNKKLTEEGGRLVLCNVAPDFAEVLRVTRFDRILNIRPNFEGALVCMDDPAIPRFSHTEKAPLCLLIYALAVVFLAVGFFVQDAPPLQWLFPPIVLLMFVLAASFHHLSVVDQGVQLAIRFGPIPLFRKTVPLDANTRGGNALHSTVYPTNS